MINNRRGFTLIELLVVISIIGVLSSITFAVLNSGRGKARDSQRISTVRQIKYALELYYGVNGQYPTCLKSGAPGCTGATFLQGSGYMSTVPNDPSGVAYSYAANGSGSNCSGYHIGVSLEEKTNRALLSGSNAPIKSICTGSAPDFSGLSFTVAGQQCNTTAGTPQPTGLANGETCYDLSE